METTTVQIETMQAEPACIFCSEKRFTVALRHYGLVACDECHENQERYSELLGALD